MTRIVDCLTRDVVAEFEGAADIDDAGVDVGSVSSFSSCCSTIGDPPGNVLVTSRSIFLKSTFFSFFYVFFQNSSNLWNLCC